VETSARTSTARRGDSPAGQIARDVSALQAALLGRLQEEMPDAGTALFASTAQKLAEEFGSVTATAIATLCDRPGPSAGPVADREPAQADLFRPGQLRRRLDQLIETHRRYGHPFGLVVFDVHGPGARDDDPSGGQETALAIVGAALHDSVRLVDETFRVEENGICVLAPSQTTVEGVQMAGRLLRLLHDLESAGGLRIGISAGVVSCPEHGTDAEALLHKADEAMWRAHAVGQPVGVGSLGGGGPVSG
jgi:diguanylate cyclase (GGDEF)-like protein